MLHVGLQQSSDSHCLRCLSFLPKRNDTQNSLRDPGRARGAPRRPRACHAIHLGTQNNPIPVPYRSFDLLFGRRLAQYVVVDMLTHRWHDAHPTARLPARTLRPACSHPARCCCQVEQGTSYFFIYFFAEKKNSGATSSRSRLRRRSSSSCGCSSRFSETRRSWWRSAKEWTQQARCGALRQPSEPGAHIRLCACTLLGWSAVQT